MPMHHIQRSIINKLASVDSCSFSDLKDDPVDNKLFTYHLKITIADNYVIKNYYGKYQLTPTGKKMWKRIAQKPSEIANRALSVIYVALKNNNGQWLIYTRKTHPFLNYSAFPHLNPHSDFSAIEIVKEFLNTTFTHYSEPVVRSCGFFRMKTRSGDIESFTNFTLIYSETDESAVPDESDAANFAWLSYGSLRNTSMLPNMALLLEKLDEPQLSFIDSSITID